MATKYIVGGMVCAASVRGFIPIMENCSKNLLEAWKWTSAHRFERGIFWGKTFYGNKWRQCMVVIFHWLRWTASATTVYMSLEKKDLVFPSSQFTNNGWRKCVLLYWVTFIKYFMPTLQRSELILSLTCKGLCQGLSSVFH